MKIKVILSVLVVLFLSKATFGQEGILFSDGSLNAILSIAKDRNKNVFIDTYADWCVPCKRMDKKFKDKDVARFFNEHFINYKVNMQNTVKANQLRKRYDIVFLPTMLIVDPDGIVKYQVDRELSTSELLNMAQKALDPSSYHISEATAVRRNTNNVVVAPKQNTTNPPTQKPVNTPTQETASTQKESTSEATRRAKLLDSYETVDESSEKVLAVLGAGELPPEVLLQEAYLRVEFMDGSHKQAAKNYLANQENWDTDTNRKFILDFVNNASSPEYDFIVSNKEVFIQQFGEEKITKTLEVLTYRALHNAVPRPSLEESKELYSNLGVKDPNRQAHFYYLSRLIADNEIEEVILTGNQYFTTNQQDHDILYMISRYLTYRDGQTSENLQLAGEYMEKALVIYPESLIYLDLLGSIYTKKGESKNAHKVYMKAIQLAKKQGKDSKPYEEKSSALNG